MARRLLDTAGELSWTTLTGAGAIVLSGERLLMIRQRRFHGVHWEFPSGYYEPGESMEQTAAREALEETAVAVEVQAFVCSMVWQREYDSRRNVLAYFLATPIDPRAEPVAQAEEDIEAAAFVDPRELEAAEVHPLHQAILDRWWTTRANGFHVHADVDVLPGDRLSYAIR